MAFTNGSITVLQDNKPLQDARVVIGNQEGQTDGDGIARFEILPDGPQDIVIIKGGERYLVQTSIQSSSLSISVNSTTTETQQQIQPRPVKLLDLGEQSITILGIVLLVLIVLSGFIFIIFFRKNIVAYQRQLKQVGMLAVLGAVAGVSALIYSQTSLLTNRTQANNFTQSTRADTRKEIPVPTNVQTTVTEDGFEFKWEIVQNQDNQVIVNGYHVEWVPQNQEDNPDAAKNMIVKDTNAAITGLEKGQVYTVKISTIDAEGNFSEPSEFVTMFPN